MFFSLAFSLLLSQQPMVTIPAGYYTLKELGDSLAQQHLSVLIAPACAKDVYALRADGVSWDSLKTALQQDDRLAITPLHDGWQVERSQTGRRDEAQARDRYVSYALSTTHAFFLAAATKVAQLEGKPLEEREAAVQKAQADAGKDSTKQDIAHLLYLYSAENDIPYTTLAFPAYLTDPAGAGFGKVWQTNLEDARYCFTPNGDLAQLGLLTGNRVVLTPDERTRWAKAFQVAMKLSWDPVTLVTSYRYVMDQSTIGQPIFVNTKPSEVIPARYRLAIPLTAVWSDAQIAAAKARTAATAPALKGDGIGTATPTPNRTMRTSEALLRSADASHTNLVCYVSRLTDSKLAAAESRSISQTISDVNEGHLDPGAAAAEVLQRTGVQHENAKSGFSMPSAMSAVAKDGILVVRNELRFLDGISDAQAVLSTKIQNGYLAGKRPNLQEVVTLVASASTPSCFASDNLDICNPASFHPFAKALYASPALMKRIEALEVNVPTTIPFSELEGAARSALANDISQCAEINDACATFAYDPVYVPVLIRKLGTGALELQVTKGSSDYSFALVHLKQQLWNSWVHL